MFWQSVLSFLFLGLVIVKGKIERDYFIMCLILYLLILIVDIIQQHRRMVSAKQGRMINLPLFLVAGWMLLDIKLHYLSLSNEAWLVGSLMWVIGRVCKSIPYNPFVGIRISSTRQNSKNWQATHLLLYELSLPLGLLMPLFVNFIDLTTAICVLFSIWLAIPIIYSVWLYPLDCLSIYTHKK